MTRVTLLSLMAPPQPGGGVRRVAAFASGLSALGYQVDTLAGGGEPTVCYRSSAAALRTAASRVKLGRVWARAMRWTAIPDGHALDIPRIALSEVPRPDLVLASAPPHSILVAGALLARRFDCPFIADLRDPWSDHPSMAAPTALHRWAQEKLESEVLGRAALVIAATEAMQSTLSSRLRVPVESIFNGYDPNLFLPRPPALDPVVGFYGSIYDPIDPEPLVRAVKAAGMTIEHAGADYDGRLERAAVQHGVEVKRLGELTGAAVAERMMRARVLALILPDDPTWGYVRTQKLAEYLASGRPILAMVPEGEAADLVRRYGAGEVVNAGDHRRAAEVLPRLAVQPSREGAALDLAWPAQVARLAALIERVRPRT